MPACALISPSLLLSPAVLCKIFFFLGKKQTSYLPGLTTCFLQISRLPGAPGTERRGPKPALLPVSCVVRWSLRVEWGEQRGKSPVSPWADNLGFQASRVCSAVTLPENRTQTPARTKPWWPFKQPGLCFKSKAVTLSCSQGTDTSGSPACQYLPSGFSTVLHPVQCRGPTYHKLWVCDPGTQTASHINLPGPPADHLSAALGFSLG